MVKVKKLSRRRIFRQSRRKLPHRIYDGGLAFKRIERVTTGRKRGDYAVMASGLPKKTFSTRKEAEKYYRSLYY